jgi:hypothetical protein
MRILISLILAVLLSGCLPIGIRGSTMPFQGPGAIDSRPLATDTR